MKNIFRRTRKENTGMWVVKWNTVHNGMIEDVYWSDENKKFKKKNDAKKFARMLRKSITILRYTHDSITDVCVYKENSSS